MKAVRWTVAFVKCPGKILWCVTTIHSAINRTNTDCQVPLRRQCASARLPHAVASREQQLKQQHFATRPMSAPNSCLLLSMLFNSRFCALCVVFLAACGVTLYATSTPQRFTSPNYPNNYRNSMDCRWTIRANEGFQVALNVTDFRLERDAGCRYDRLQVYSGSYKCSTFMYFNLT